MKKGFLFCFICLASIQCAIARSAFLLCAGGGINKIVVSSIQTKMGFNNYFGLSSNIYPSSVRMGFFPSIYLSNNYYRSSLEQNIFLKLRQESVFLKLCTGFMTKGNFVFKSGIYTSYVKSSTAKIEYNTSNGISGAWSNTGLYNYYDPQKIQIGIVLDVLIPIMESQRIMLDLQLQKHATSIVLSDFLIEDSTGAPTLAFSKRSSPVAVYLGVSYKLAKKKRKQK